jgi:hypothetical protein
MAFNFGLYAPFENMYNWKGIWEKEGEIDCTKAYVTNDESSR